MAVVDAIFTIDGNSYRGVNPCDRIDRIDRIEGVNEGLSAPNAKMSTMHAEVEAMTNAQKAGVRGGDGMLEIQGKKDVSLL